MTQSEKIIKVIEKAEQNGYRIDEKRPSELCWWMEGFVIEDFTLFDIIFSHDFAKAFWGDKGLLKSVIEYDHEIPWKKVKDKELGVYYKDANHDKFLKEKSSAHLIFKKDGKYVAKKSDPYGDFFEPIELGTWGEYPIASDYGYWSEGWKHYLSQMVLEDSPLKYLEKFL